MQQIKLSITYKFIKPLLFENQIKDFKVIKLLENSTNNKQKEKFNKLAANFNKLYIKMLNCYTIERTNEEIFFFNITNVCTINASLTDEIKKSFVIIAIFLELNKTTLDDRFENLEIMIKGLEIQL